MLTGEPLLLQINRSQLVLASRQNRTLLSGTSSYKQTLKQIYDAPVGGTTLISLSSLLAAVFSWRSWWSSNPPGLAGLPSLLTKVWIVSGKRMEEKGTGVFQSNNAFILKSTKNEQIVYS